MKKSNIQFKNNIFQISASNNYGYASDETIVFYSSTLPMPMVDITTPYTNPYNSLNSTTNVRATILNVENKYNIEFYINGNRSYGFDFSATQFEAKSISLFPGKNRIRIVGKNLYSCYHCQWQLNCYSIQKITLIPLLQET